MTERAYFELRGRAHKRAPEALICRGLEVFAKLLFYVFFGLKFPPAPGIPSLPASPSLVILSTGTFPNLNR